MERKHTTAVKVGNITIGSQYPISVQTMCNTDTCDIEASVAQCRSAASLGADLVRLTTQGHKQVEALKQIKERLRKEGITTPLVADIHFNAQAAFEAAAVADKVRINPGNFSPEREKSHDLLCRLIELCRTYGTALRIGVNHGSLSKEMVSLYGNTPRGMALGAMEYLYVCRSMDFNNVVLSLKSSNSRVMAQAYTILSAEMEKEGMAFPLHLGVTEAGEGRSARMKSASAIANLLQKGLGDTIRVSLTENPANEVIFGKKMLDCFHRWENFGGSEIEAADEDELISAASWLYGARLLETPAKELEIKARINGKKLSSEYLKEFSSDLLQATRCLFTKNEYISCPGCGRTLYNLQETVKAVKEATAHLSGYTIAVMGCIVNGPGEMADADYGYVGEGAGKVSLYRGKERVMQGIPQEKAVEQLLKLIENKI